MDPVPFDPPPAYSSNRTFAGVAEEAGDNPDFQAVLESLRGLIAREETAKLLKNQLGRLRSIGTLLVETSTKSSKDSKDLSELLDNSAKVLEDVLVKLQDEDRWITVLENPNRLEDLERGVEEGFDRILSELRKVLTLDELEFSAYRQDLRKAQQHDRTKIEELEAIVKHTSRPGDSLDSVIKNSIKGYLKVIGGQTVGQKRMDARRALTIVTELTGQTLPPSTVLGKDFVNIDQHPFHQGRSYDIYRGEYFTGEKVAIKILKHRVDENTAMQTHHRFARQAQTWSSMEHGAILRFYGFGIMESLAIPGKYQLYMVSPYWQNQDISRYLRKCPGARCTARLQMILDVAHALDYMHEVADPPEQGHGVVHSALNIYNVLVKDSGRVVISGFGHSKVIKDFDEIFTGDFTEYKYMAPETMNEENISYGTDIWSWAMTSLEILSDVPPFGNKFRGPSIITALANGQRPDRLQHPKLEEYGYPDELWSLFTKCWEQNPEARPSAKQLVEHIEPMLETLREDKLLGQYSRVWTAISQPAALSTAPTPAAALPKQSHERTPLDVNRALDPSPPYAETSTTGHFHPPLMNKQVSQPQIPPPPMTSTSSYSYSETPSRLALGYDPPPMPSIGLRSGAFGVMQAAAGPGNATVMPAWNIPETPDVDSRGPLNGADYRYNSDTLMLSEEARIDWARRAQKLDSDGRGNAFVRASPASIADVSKKPHFKISSRMASSKEIIGHLKAYRCSDLTENLQATGWHDSPVAGGGFADVYHWGLQDGTPVAIKLPRLFPRDDKRGQKAIKDAAREISIASKLKHVNVVEVLGAALFKGSLAIISPWMENGTVMQYLEDNPSMDRCKLCRDIASGLSHMHHKDTVHGDLKGSNILVSQDGIAKITDFGSSSMKSYTVEFTGTDEFLGCSVRWTPHEFFTGKATPTKEADVYSLSMTIFEIITGKIPFHDVANHGVVWRIRDRQLPARLQDWIPSNDHGDKLWQIIEDCWAYEPSDRPLAAQVVTALLGITQKGLDQRPVPDTIIDLNAIDTQTDITHNFEGTKSEIRVDLVRTSDDNGLAGRDTQQGEPATPFTSRHDILEATNSSSEKQELCEAQDRGNRGRDSLLRSLNRCRYVY